MVIGFSMGMEMVEAGRGRISLPQQNQLFLVMVDSHKSIYLNGAQGNIVLNRFTQLRIYQIPPLQQLK